MTHAEAREALGVEAGCTETDLRRAYARAVKAHPPDRDPEGFKRMREALEALRAPEPAPVAESHEPNDDSDETAPTRRVRVVTFAAPVPPTPPKRLEPNLETLHLERAVAMLHAGDVRGAREQMAGTSPYGPIDTVLRQALLEITHLPDGTPPMIIAMLTRAFLGDAQARAWLHHLGDVRPAVGNALFDELFNRTGTSHVIRVTGLQQRVYSPNSGQRLQDVPGFPTERLAWGAEALEMLAEGRIEEAAAVIDRERPSWTPQLDVSADGDARRCAADLVEISAKLPTPVLQALARGMQQPPVLPDPLRDLAAGRPHLALTASEAIATLPATSVLARRIKDRLTLGIFGYLSHKTTMEGTGVTARAASRIETALVATFCTVAALLSTVIWATTDVAPPFAAAFALAGCSAAAAGAFGALQIRRARLTATSAGDGQAWLVVAVGIVVATLLITIWAGSSTSAR